MATKKPQANEAAVGVETPEPAAEPTPSRPPSVGVRVLYGGLAGGELAAMYADVLAVDGEGLPTLRIHHPDGSVDVQTRVEEALTLERGRWTRGYAVY